MDRDEGEEVPWPADASPACRFLPLCFFEVVDGWRGTATRSCQSGSGSSRVALEVEGRGEAKGWGLDEKLQVHGRRTRALLSLAKLIQQDVVLW